MVTLWSNEKVRSPLLDSEMAGWLWVYAEVVDIILDVELKILRVLDERVVEWAGCRCIFYA